MEQIKKAPVVTEPVVQSMIKTNDFAPVVGHADEFISVLLNATPELMKLALDAAYKNTQVKKEINAYIRTTSTKILNESSKLINLEQESLKQSNKQLNKVLIQLTNKEEMTASDVEIFLITIKELRWNSERMKEISDDARRRITRIQEDPALQIKKDHPVFEALLDVLQTPQGFQAAADLTLLVGKALYDAFAKKRS